MSDRLGVMLCGHGSRDSEAVREFAVLAISGKDVKLGLALGDASARDGLEPARIPGAGPAITHMAALSDVRRVDATLLAHVAHAAALASA